MVLAIVVVKGFECQKRGAAGIRRRPARGCPNALAPQNAPCVSIDQGRGEVGLASKSGIPFGNPKQCTWIDPFGRCPRARNPEAAPPTRPHPVANLLL